MAFPPDQQLDDIVTFWTRNTREEDFARMERRARWSRLTWRVTITIMEGAKRFMDILGGGVALLLFSPIYAATILAIKLEDGGPIFYRQTRIGQGGRPFKMIKFRSMVTNADKLKDQLLAQNQHGEGVTFKMKDDPRVTRVGKFIRKFSIDELPQFYNVLVGEMSIVGPRPPVPREVDLYQAFHLRRLKIKPGITCLWQIGGRAEIDFEGQVRLDLQYIHSSNVWKDILIILKTVPAVLFGKGAY